MSAALERLERLGAPQQLEAYWRDRLSTLEANERRVVEAAAWAAGERPANPDDLAAVIGITQGALERLSRDELQGVIAHEFSHVLNGDMRLNIRLMGVLFGILFLSLIGRMIIRGGHHASLASSRRGKGGGAIVLIGLGLAILGGVGVFFARMIKAAVSRQREYLADASAVQFTRQTDGIADYRVGSGHPYLSLIQQFADGLKILYPSRSTRLRRLS